MIEKSRFKCEQNVKTKNGITTKCGRYLGDLADDRVYIRCPACGGFTVVVLDDKIVTTSALTEAINELAAKIQKEN